MEDFENKELWPGWKTVRLIGRGSFGGVYEIERDIFGHKEKSALKLITIPQNDSDIDELYDSGYDEASITLTYKARLENIVNEYTLMRSMNGTANIVNCDDFRVIEHQDQIGWDILIKMELLTPLTKVVGSNPTEAQTLQLATDMCNALILCKKKGIIHRDIKPQNIFVSPNGDYKLGDFGIAKTLEKTSGGTRIGTYKYMAPEIFNNQPYNHTADIYSLGLVLYWMLNEKRAPFMPLPPEIQKNTDEEDARQRRMSGEAMPAPAHGSEELKRIILKACAYDMKDRYQNAEEMLADLEALKLKKNKIFVSGTAEPDSQIAAEQNAGYKEDTMEQSSGLDATMGVWKKPNPVKKAEDPKVKNKKPGLWVWITAAAVAATLIICFFTVHIWTEPSWTEPAVCKICGKTGEEMIEHKYILCDESMTWEEARKAAALMGGHLATINSEEEQKEIEQLIATGSKKQYWLGGYRNEENEFQWITGEDFLYTNWDNCEPTNFNENENYLQIYLTPNPQIGGSQSFKWNDAANNNTIEREPFFRLKNVGFIVEFDRHLLAETTSSVSEGDTEHYYRVLKIDGEFSWDDAEAYCESIGGHLATLTDEKQTAAAYQAYVESEAYLQGAYFGLSDVKGEGKWEWVTGEGFEYKSWQDGEPNGNTYENYAEFYYNNSGISWNGKWIDGSFTESENKYIICEWDISDADWRLMLYNDDAFNTKGKFTLMPFKEKDTSGDSYIWGQETYCRKDVESVVFTRGLYKASDGAWDISEAGDGSILAWIEEKILYIASDGIIVSGPDSCYWMFSRFENMNSIYFGPYFDTSNATNINAMFTYCKSLIEADLSCFNTSKVTDMGGMFNGCTSLEKVDVTSFDTSNVTYFGWMFGNNQNLKTVDVSGFDTSSCTAMSCMFYGCSSLKYVDISNFTVSKNTWCSSVFSNCDKLSEDVYTLFEEKRIGRLKGAEAGDVVFFGSYEQDNSTSNGEEDIKWIVLDKKGDSLLVISQSALDCKPFNTEFVSITWENCTLRKWMNNDFINEAFSGAEQTLIIETEVPAYKNPEYDTDPGNPTTDKLFLLSEDEAGKYFTSDESRICAPSKYAIGQGSLATDDGKCIWWLRSHSEYNGIVKFVHGDGTISTDGGKNVNRDYVSVRPVMWINISG